NHLVRPLESSSALPRVLARVYAWMLPSGVSISGRPHWSRAIRCRVSAPDKNFSASVVLTSSSPSFRSLQDQKSRASRQSSPLGVGGWSGLSVLGSLAGAVLDWTGLRWTASDLGKSRESRSGWTVWTPPSGQSRTPCLEIV